MRLLFAFLPLLCFAEGMLVETADLAKHLLDRDLVLLHVGSEKDYVEMHIPGARLVRLSDISITEGDLRLQLPTVHQLQVAFGKLGVSSTSRIVVYAGTSSVQSATRVWFTLDYLGLGARTSLLNGGLALWRAEGRPTSTAPVEATPATFHPLPNPALVVDAEFIRKSGGAVKVIDARTEEFYSGANAGQMSRAGRIPGARHVPYHSLLDESMRFLPAETLRAVLGGGDKPIITYCHIGQQATVPYFAARMLGYDVRLYDGSFQDWSSRTNLPVEKDNP